MNSKEKVSLGDRYRSGRTGLVSTVQVTQREGAGYRWTPCLTLLTPEGKWAISAHWRTNARRKMHRDLASMGFVRLGSTA